MNVGPGEILFIAIIALLIFGPQRLPELARSVGKALREFQRASREIGEELEAELDKSSEQPRPPSLEERRPGPRG